MLNVDITFDDSTAFTVSCAHYSFMATKYVRSLMLQFSDFAALAFLLKRLLHARQLNSSFTGSA